MAEQVRIDLVADDKASKPIDALAKKVDALESADVKIPVDADTAPAQKDIGDLLSKVDRLAKDPATLLLTTNATSIASQIADLTIDLDKLDANDPEVQVKSEQINSLQGDLDQVTAKIKEVNGVPLDLNTEPAKKGIEEVGKSADSSKSVLANMIGNSAQDLGALGGIAGSAGVAFGQMGEYMADARNEGEGLGSVLSNFADVAGPIVIITTAISVLTGVLQDQADAAKASQERIKQFGEAFSSAMPHATALAASLAKNTDVMEKFNAEGEGFGGGFVDRISTVAKHIPLLGSAIGDAGQNITDLNELLTKGGLSLYQFSQSVEQGGRVGDEFSKSLLRANEAGKLTDQETSFLIQALGTYGQEAQKAKDQQDLVTQALIEGHEPLRELNAAYAAAYDPTAQYARVQSEAATEIDKVTKLLQDQAQEMTDRISAGTDAADAQRDENKAMQDFAAALKDAKKSTDDQVDAAIGLAKAHQATTDAMAKASGQTQTATDRTDTFNDSLLNTAGNLNTKARTAIANYLADMNQIPPDKRTDFIAAVSAGDLATARQLLNDTSVTRQAAIIADADTAAANRQLADAANPGGKPRTAQVQAVLINPNFGIGTTPRSINGPNVNAAPVPGATVVNVTQHLPRGWRGDALTEARRQARRSGGLYQRFSR